MVITLYFKNSRLHEDQVQIADCRQPTNTGYNTAKMLTIATTVALTLCSLKAITLLGAIADNVMLSP